MRLGVGSDNERTTPALVVITTHNNYPLRIGSIRAHHDTLIPHSTFKFTLTSLSNSLDDPLNALFIAMSEVGYLSKARYGQASLSSAGRIQLTCAQAKTSSGYAEWFVMAINIMSPSIPSAVGHETRLWSLVVAR